MEYPKELHERHNELPFLVKRIKIGREDKLVTNLKDKKGCVVHIQKTESSIKAWFEIKKGTPGY